MITLNEEALATIDSLAVPRYDRRQLRTGIVHFGFGSFHRAHQAMYVDRLLENGEAFEWGICGVGLLPDDLQMRDVMSAQNGLYTLVLKHAGGQLEGRIVGSVHRYLYAPDDPEAVLSVLSQAATRIVSLTVTEGGYNIDAVSGEFLLESDDVSHDLEEGAVPRSVFGYIVEALRRRRVAGVAPFGVMSCDNIQGNGDVARRAIVTFAHALDPELAAWIENSVAFPNSMVDRITPRTTDADRTLVEEEFGISDAWPVVCEPFEQWVLEDSLLERPPYENAGVQLVDDVVPYELMKLRLLNASHQAMAYFGYLSGYRYVHEAAADPLIRRFLERYMDEEATATLDAVPGIDLGLYKATLLERFSNPEIRDTLARLCAETSDRIPKWLLPVVRSNLENDGAVDLSAAIVASWAKYAEGVDEHGNAIEVDDRLADRLGDLARQQAENALAFLSADDLFGELDKVVRFTRPYLRALESLHTVGANRTLAELDRR